MLKNAIAQCKPLSSYAVLLSALSLAGCGGGDAASDSDISTQATSARATVQSVEGVKVQADHPDDLAPPLTAELTPESVQKMEAIEAAALAQSDSPANATREKSATQAVLAAQSLDEVAQYSVGFLSADVGQYGQTLKTRRGSSVASFSLVSTASAAPLPDLLYLRAGNFDPLKVKRSAIFKQAVAQGKAILVEREATGDAQYRKLLLELFNGVPTKSNAVLIRPVGDESFGFYLIDGEDDSHSLNAVSSTGLAPYRLNLDTIASVLQEHDQDGEVSSNNVLVTSMVGATATPEPLIGRYTVGQQVSPTVHPRYIVNPHTWQWETRADTCKTHTCAAYNKTKIDHVGWNPTFVNAVWWDDWLVCGGVKVDPNNSCTTAYQSETKTLKGMDQAVTAELGVTVTAEVEGGFLGFAKAKASTAVTAKAGYGKTWRKETSYTYLSRYQNEVKQGYRTRFGRGNYTMNVAQWFTGRHESKMDIGVFGGGCRMIYMWWWGGSPNLYDTKFWRSDCASTWNPKYQQRVQVTGLKEFGVKHWAICKNSDTKCINTYNSGTTAERSKLFPL